MSNVYSFLEERGLVTAAQVVSSYKAWTPKESAELRDGLLNALQADKELMSDSSKGITVGEFQFFASSSIRGDYGCDEWDCRATKAGNLARYSALYCENVIVPVRLNIHAGPKTNDRSFKYDLAGTFLCLQEFRPAAESGILRLVPDALYYCSDCEREATERFTRTVKAAQDFLLQNQDKFSAEYVPPDSEISLTRVEIKGPDEYIEHGRMMTIYFEEPEWLQTLGTSGRPKSRYSFSPIEVEKTGVVRSILSRLAGDAAFQQAYGMRYGVKCLTNLPAQAQVLNILNDDQYMAQCTSGLLASMNHSIPILNELPTATVVRIRKEEPDAFLTYRAALGKILTEYVKTKKHVASSEAKEIYSDLLLPEILRLRAASRNYRKSEVAGALKKFTFSAVAVTLGLFGGLPGQIAAAFKVAGATSLLRDVHDAVSESQKNKSEVRNENFYFLLRVLDESD